jgi:acyl-CoA synthetase (AMP-forming)/AMP-acid ligase II
MVRVVNDRGEDVEGGEVGEIIVKGPAVMKEYYKNPEKTAETIKDGWLCTGDMAKQDEEGFIYVVDRKKDLVIVGGENIYPAEIEDALLQNPKVADVGVIGYPHEKWGEAVKAIVVVKQGEKLNEQELIAWCQGRIGKFKIPKKVVFADSIPRTPTGKILKRVLREQYNEEHAQ